MSNVYDKAIDAIHAQGWTQGTYSDVTGICAVGALRAAIFGSAKYIGRSTAGRPDLFRFRYDEYVTAIEYLGGVQNLVRWNDTPGRTADDVIHRFKEASESWELMHE
jgi:hypothetical protein